MKQMTSFLFILISQSSFKSFYQRFVIFGVSSDYHQQFYCPIVNFCSSTLLLLEANLLHSSTFENTPFDLKNIL